MSDQEPDEQQRLQPLELLRQGLGELHREQPLQQSEVAIDVFMEEGPDARYKTGPFLVNSAVSGNKYSRQEGESVAPISLYFELESFSPTDIADIIALLSELYTDIGGDGLIIDDVTLLDFQPAILPVEV